MPLMNMSPWAVFEVEHATADYTGVFELSEDLSTVTITDNSTSGRYCLNFSVGCEPGDVIEFFVEAEAVSGTMSCSVQCGTVYSVNTDAMGSLTRDLKTIDATDGPGYKTYRMRCIVPSIETQYRVTFFVGGAAANSGSARYRNPKMFVNGNQVGAPLLSCRADNIGINSNYSTEFLSPLVDMTCPQQQDGGPGYVGNPWLFKIGAYRQAKKFLGSGMASSTIVLAQFNGTSAGEGAGFRFFKSAATGPCLQSSGIEAGVIGFIDAFYDTGEEHKRAGRINFYYKDTDSMVFSITTPNLSDEEDANGLYVWKSGAFSPKTDGTADCGTPAHRWNTVRATTGSINTSDIRAKDNLEAPSDALMRAWGKVNFKIFQMRDAIAEKGADKARLHVGIIAQEVQAAFASEGLDASRYGLFCYDKWEDEYETETVVDVEEHVDAETGEIVPAQTHNERRLVRSAGDLYGIRYEEALALECAYQRWLGEKREARIAALEARLAGAGE